MAFLDFELDPRFKSHLRAGTFSGVLGVLLYTAAASVSVSAYITVGVLLFISLATPPCLIWGVYKKNTPSLSAFCCCSGFLIFLALIAIISVYAFEEPRLQCVCDHTCTVMPSTGYARSGNTNLAVLRNSTLYSKQLCPRESSILSAYSVFVALVVLGILSLFVSCGLVCFVRSKWVAEDQTTASGGVSTNWVYPTRRLFNPYAQVARVSQLGIPMAIYACPPPSLPVPLAPSAAPATEAAVPVTTSTAISPPAPSAGAPLTATS